MQIPDELYAQLQQECERLGCSRESLAEEAIRSRLLDSAEPPQELTPAQINRMRESIAQLARGEVVTSEEVDQKFEKFFRKLANRLEAA